jgi:phosphoribosyl-ATP pyrophosphohydrolase/phosphoribosyl-AMP cyclohydrolase
MNLSQLKYDADGFVTVVVQDRLTGEVRMLAHADQRALQATLDSGDAHFFSRSRQALWRKGESSGHVLRVAEIWTDCDADAVIYLVDAEGPSCHTGRETCFFRVIDRQGDVKDDARHAQSVLPRLWTELDARRQAPSGSSYTRKLLDAGALQIGAKIREEADELARAIADESDERVVSEAADEIYHVLVGLLSRGVDLRAVEAELSRRFGVSGLAEKASRTSRS